MTSQTQTTRSPKGQEKHNRMVEAVAKELVRKGFLIKADSIEWSDGVPPVLGENFKPDIIAFKDSIFHIIEVETCSTFQSAETAHQLQIFSGKGKTTVIVPTVCRSRTDLVLKMRESLREWGLQSVKIGTCDPATGKVELPREMDA
ncbi:hypothetical protein [Salinithrix halophila]|uniref:Uncharacterized protein n=1 Tax=Salinithrix halophila TaxID=1485204 RepID=A0ABV8JI64_9BACL